jgi:hypothetical protein
MLLDTLTYDNLFAGDFDVVTEPILIAAGQTIVRGDLLVKLVSESIAVADAVGTVNRTAATSYVKASAAATQESFYAIAAEDVTTVGSTATIIGYKTGIFNEFAVGFGGTATADNCRDILAAQSIFLQKANKQ